MNKIFSKFEPLKDNHLNLPNEPGNYIICLKKGSTIKIEGHKIIFEKYEGLNVLYTGISKKIRTRDFRQHFIGNNAGSSTLRKSIGVLRGYKLIPRDKGKTTNGKTKFNETNEIELSEWMTKNLVLFYILNKETNELENELIEKYNPPLNLSKNKNTNNKLFREQLSILRNKK